MGFGTRRGVFGAKMAAVWRQNGGFGGKVEALGAQTRCWEDEMVPFGRQNGGVGDKMVAFWGVSKVAALWHQVFLSWCRNWGNEMGGLAPKRRV